MPQEENPPEFIGLPESSVGPGRARGTDAPAPSSAVSPSAALTIAACLVLVLCALYFFRRTAAQPELPLAAEGPAPAADVPAAPVQTAPEYSGGAPTDHLTGATGLAQEENIRPPATGLLVAPSSLETITYNGPAPAPEVIAKDTAEDKAGCKAGDMFKCLRLGGRYMSGYGVERDGVRAFGLINRACAGGIAEACTAQGIMQMSGYGTPKDPAAGLALQEKTCASGDMLGCTALGSLYIDGVLVPADIPRGMGYISKACDAKLGVGCLTLGLLFNDGKAVPRDPAQAEYLLGRACELGEKKGCLLQQQLVQKRIEAQNGR